MVGVRPRRAMARLCAVASLTALVLSMLAGAALATEPECPSVADSVVYYVDGNKVDHLHGKVVSQGSTVQVKVTIPEGCDSVELTLASYESPKPEFDKNQVLYDHDTGDYSGEMTLEVRVPPCYFQVDFAYGPVIESFAGGDKYGKRLIDAAIGGTNVCASASPSPSPTDSPSTTESPSQPAESPSPTGSPTDTPSPSESSTGPTETPTPTDSPTETPSPVQPSDEGPVGGGDDDEPVAAPRSRLASTGIPVLVLALLALVGIGTGTTLLHTSRRRRTD